MFLVKVFSDYLNSKWLISEQVANKERPFNDTILELFPKKIGKILDTKTPITSYVARHTFATTLKKNKADISKSVKRGTDVNVTKAI
ncbi:MAG: hypothetical protein R2784_02525 [Saprospiraceae bacterium]